MTESRRNDCRRGLLVFKDPKHLNDQIEGKIYYVKNKKGG